MAAISLFWDTNMAAVTSCENTLFVFFFNFLIFYLLHMIVLHKVTVREKGVEKGIIQLTNCMLFTITIQYLLR